MAKLAWKSAFWGGIILLAGCAPILFLPDTKYHPSLKWQTRETAHFAIHFHQGEEQIAQKVAVISERVHQSLSPILRWQPKSRTQLILVDNEDEVSGAATPIPYNTIYINLTPPAGTVFLINYEDWLRLVITHEYTHVLHLDTVSGVDELLRGVFGRVPFILFPFFTSVPNLWQPTWLIEGLATYEETQLGTSDRRDGAFSEMVLRTAILEDQFPKLDQADGLDRWPSGQIPYLFGSKFYQFIAQKYGERYITEISKSYSERTIPFFIESNARVVLGSRYGSLWSEWKESLSKKYSEEKLKLESRGLTPSQRLTDRGYMILGPVFAPDGQSIAYSETNADSYPSLRIINTDGTGDRALSLRNSGFYLSRSPDGQQIAFAQMEIYKNYSVYSDLYLIDVKTQKTRRLTYGLRAKDPAFSPDGKRLIFVLNKLGQSQLAVLDLTSSKIQMLTESTEEMQYAHPRWSPDGKLIALSVWHKGQQDIGLFDPTTHSLKWITQDFPMDLTPAWSPDGHWIYFTSERTAIYNTFAFSVQDGSLHQVTNVLGGAFMPYPSPDGKQLAFVNYTARGFDLHVMDLDPKAWKEVQASPSTIGTKTDPVDSADHQPMPMPLRSSPPRSYSPFPTILPRFWVPIFGGDEDGLQTGLLTGGLDVLGKHKYSLVALYGIESQRLAYHLSYQNDQFFPTLRFRLSDLAFLHTDLLRNSSGHEIDYWERQQRVSADIILPVLKFRWFQELSLGYQREQLSSVTTIPGGFQVPEEGILSGGRIAWEYNSAKQYGYSIGREDGRKLSVSYERMDEGLGSDFTLNRYVGGWYEYLTLPYLKHHVLAGRLVGGLATGDVLLQRAFQLGSPLISEEIITLDETSYFLRGYPARSFKGQRMALASLEYRFPVLNIERGVRTWPFFFRRIHGTLFADTGNAWDKHSRIRDFKTGVGGEVKLDLNLAYHLTGLRFRLGIAYGLDQEGVLRGYLAAGNAF